MAASKKTVASAKKSVPTKVKKVTVKAEKKPVASKKAAAKKTTASKVIPKVSSKAKAATSSQSKAKKTVAKVTTQKAAPAKTKSSPAVKAKLKMAVPKKVLGKTTATKSTKTTAKPTSKSNKATPKPVAKPTTKTKVGPTAKTKVANKPAPKTVIKTPAAKVAAPKKGANKTSLTTVATPKVVTNKISVVKSVVIEKKISTPSMVKPNKKPKNIEKFEYNKGYSMPETLLEPQAIPALDSIVERQNSIIAGIEGLVPYKPVEGEAYMSDAQIKHFRVILEAMRQQLMEDVDRTVNDMRDSDKNLSDFTDRATNEEEMFFMLRTRTREGKLLKKIEEALDRVEHQDYGFCDNCGIEIGIRRLEARPTATLCIDCKTLDEIREKQRGS